MAELTGKVENEMFGFKGAFKQGFFYFQINSENVVVNRTYKGSIKNVETPVQVGTDRNTGAQSAMYSIDPHDGPFTFEITNGADFLKFKIENKQIKFV